MSRKRKSCSGKGRSPINSSERSPLALSRAKAAFLADQPADQNHNASHQREQGQASNEKRPTSEETDRHGAMFRMLNYRLHVSPHCFGLGLSPDQGGIFPQLDVQRRRTQILHTLNESLGNVGQQ